MVTTNQHDDKTDKYTCNAKAYVTLPPALKAKADQLIQLDASKLGQATDTLEMLNMGPSWLTQKYRERFDEIVGLQQKLKFVDYAGGAINQPILFTAQRSANKENQIVVEVLGTGPLADVVNELEAFKPPAGQAPGNASPADVTGVWKGQLEGNGEMTIKPGANGFDVSLSVAGNSAGGSACHGQLDGSASLTANVMTLKKLDQAGEGCTVKITFSGDKAELAEDGPCIYHGAACSFEGTLEKVR